MHLQRLWNRCGNSIPKLLRALHGNSNVCVFARQVKGPEYQGMHPAKLVFQALRIHLNDEFGELRRGIQIADSQVILICSKLFLDYFILNFVPLCNLKGVQCT